VLSDWELWACAHQVRALHVSGAPLHVAEQIGALVLSGDGEGIRVWQEIASRIAELDTAAKPTGTN